MDGSVTVVAMVGTFDFTETELLRREFIATSIFSGIADRVKPSSRG